MWTIHNMGLSSGIIGGITGSISILCIETRNQSPIVHPAAPDVTGPFENAWMSRPLADHLGVASASIRKQRNDYFDSLIGAPAPLTPQISKQTGISEGSY